MKFRSVDFLVGCFGISIVLGSLNRMGLLTNMDDLVRLCLMAVCSFLVVGFGFLIYKGAVG